MGLGTFIGLLSIFRQTCSRKSLLSVFLAQIVFFVLSQCDAYSLELYTKNV
ncbi:hypothetical protein Plhal304r1_c027g0089891 [Plasmopara halstedii]